MYNMVSVKPFVVWGESRLKVRKAINTVSTQRDLILLRPAVRIDRWLGNYNTLKVMFFSYNGRSLLAIIELIAGRVNLVSENASR